MTARDVEEGIGEARRRFDAMVIEPAMHHLPPSAVRFLLAMAEDGDRTSETAEVAARLNGSITSVSPLRARLIKEGVVESSGRGRIGFAIPYLADYLMRNREETGAGVRLTSSAPPPASRPAMASRPEPVPLPYHGFVGSSPFTPTSGRRERTRNAHNAMPTTMATTVVVPSPVKVVRPGQKRHEHADGADDAPHEADER